MWLRSVPLFKNFKKSIKRASGRSLGKITVRHRGGGFRPIKTLVDYHRFIWNIPAIVTSVEKHGGTRSYLAGITYMCGVASYILAPQGLRPGAKIEAGPNAIPTLGSCLFLKDIPFHVKIHNIESRPYSGAKFVRSAGSWATIVDRGPTTTTLLFRSGVRKTLSNSCMAVIGRVSNIFNNKRSVMYKAGQQRRRGRRPSVRGVVQNPVDHPHGGGKGKKSPKNPNYNFVRKLPKGRKTRRKY